jgi:ferredoxin
MKLTAQQIKQFAAEQGHTLVGIANIERFRNAPRGMHPCNIFPDCRSVISIARPIPRGVYRGITEGTHWSNYTYYGYNRLNTLFRPAVTYRMACFIEDQGFEAVPLYPGVPERPGMRKPVAPDRPAPEINLNVRIAAVACGLGEIGWSKVFLTKRYGPRVRIGTILTDAELESDPLMEPGTLCNRCMRCVRDCPGRAIPMPGERPPISIQIDDKTYQWGDVHMGRCTLTHHGMNWEASPFLKKDFPGLDVGVRQSNLSEESAYRLCYPMATATWPANPEFPSSACMSFYNQIKSHIQYFAVCGAKGCIRACMDSLEKRHAVEQSDFPTAVAPRPAWQLTPPEADDTGGIAEGKFPAMYNDPDPCPGDWE